MDPTANWAEQVRLARAIQDRQGAADPDLGISDEDRAANEDDAESLAELVLALNTWLASGGFPPRPAAEPPARAASSTT
jgi:hypothetical protein